MIRRFHIVFDKWLKNTLLCILLGSSTGGAEVPFYKHTVALEGLLGIQHIESLASRQLALAEYVNNFDSNLFPLLGKEILDRRDSPFWVETGCLLFSQWSILSLDTLIPFWKSERNLLYEHSFIRSIQETLYLHSPQALERFNDEALRSERSTGSPPIWLSEKRFHEWLDRSNDFSAKAHSLSRLLRGSFGHKSNLARHYFRDLDDDTKNHIFRASHNSRDSIPYFYLVPIIDEITDSELRNFVTRESAISFIENAKYSGLEWSKWRLSPDKLLEVRLIAASESEATNAEDAISLLREFYYHTNSTTNPEQESLSDYLKNQEIEKAISSLLYKSAVQDPNRLLDFINQAPTKALMTTLKNRVALYLLNSLEGEEMLVWAKKMPPGEKRKELLLYIISNIAKTDVNEALAVALNLTWAESDEQSEAVASALGSMASVDITGAVEMLDSLDVNPSIDTDIAYGEITRAFLELEKEPVLDWIENNERARMSASAIEQLASDRRIARDFTTRLVSLIENIQREDARARVQATFEETLAYSSIFPPFGSPELGIR